MPFDTDKLTFKAVRYSSSAEALSIKDHTIPLVKQPDGKYDVAEDKILVKVHAAALNPIDFVLHHTAPPLLSRFIDSGYGKDYSGTIVSIGSKAAKNTTVKVGDKIQGLYPHVYADGTLAEYLLLTDGLTDSEYTTIPSNLSFSDAAGWPLVFGTAYELLKQADLKPDAKVLVLGGSTSVGRFVIQLAKNVHGAKEIVTTNSDESDELVRSLGATSTINYRLHKSILNPCLELVKDAGKFDIIFDTCGSSDLFSNINDVLKSRQEGGRYLSIVGDFKYDYKVQSFTPYGVYSLIKRLLLNKLGLSSFDYRFILTTPGEKWIEQGRKLIEEGKVKNFTDSTYEFADFQKAVDRLLSNRARGKVVVKIED